MPSGPTTSAGGAVDGLGGLAAVFAAAFLAAAFFAGAFFAAAPLSAAASAAVASWPRSSAGAFFAAAFLARRRVTFFARRRRGGDPLGRLVSSADDQTETPFLAQEPEHGLAGAGGSARQPRRSGGRASAETSRSALPRVDQGHHVGVGQASAGQLAGRARRHELPLVQGMRGAAKPVVVKSR